MNIQTKKVLVLANNNAFTTWNEKTDFVKNFYAPLVNLNFSIFPTNFSVVPVSEATLNGAPGTQNQPYSAPCVAYIVDPVWYETNIIKLAVGYDAVIFAVNVADISPATTLLPAADNTGSFDGIDMITIYIQPDSENWPATQSGITYPSSIAFILAHEISHWLYALVRAAVDDTHEYFYSAHPEGVLPELLRAMQIEEQAAAMVLFKPKIVTWARAIQEQESSKPELFTDRNVVNDNPGNLKKTSYTTSLGATKADEGNFCIFPNYATGFMALCHFLNTAASNELYAYHNATLRSFTETYAQPPNDGYLNGVAADLGVSPDVLISTLIE